MKRKTIEKLALILIISLGNFWIWRIFNTSLFLAVAIVLLTIFLLFRFKTLALVVFAILSLFLLRSTVDTNLKYISPLEKNRLTMQQEYFGPSLGRLFKNRFGLYLHYDFLPYVAKYERNFAYNLDPNLYFFKSHPRERGGIVEFEKFSPFFLPFFIVGVIILISGGFTYLVLYLIVSQIVNAFLFPGYDLGPVLIFPFIVSTIYLGVLKVLGRNYET